MHSGADFAADELVAFTSDLITYFLAKHCLVELLSWHLEPWLQHLLLENRFVQQLVFVIFLVICLIKPIVPEVGATGLGRMHFALMGILRCLPKCYSTKRLSRGLLFFSYWYFLVITITYPGTASSIFSYKDADFKEVKVLSRVTSGVGEEATQAHTGQTPNFKLSPSYNSGLQSVLGGLSVFILKERKTEAHVSSFNPDNKPKILCTIDLEVRWVSEENNCSAWGEMEGKGFLKCFHFTPTHKHRMDPKAVRPDRLALSLTSGGQIVCDNSRSEVSQPAPRLGFDR